MSTKPPIPPIPPIGRRSPRADSTAPDCSEIRLLAGDSQGASKASLCEVSLPSALTSKPVRHRRVEEIWYVIAGHGRVWRCPPGREAVSVPADPVGPGDALTIPTGWAFQFQAAADGPLRFLCYTTPAWPGDEEAQPVSIGGLGPPTACSEAPPD